MTETETKIGQKRPYVWGRYSLLVFSLAVAGVVLDQATKLWLLYWVDPVANGPMTVLPVLDFILVWNRGISYGLFQQHSDLGRWLLVGFTVIATLVLWVWSARATSVFLAITLAMVISGAVGNGIDRVTYGAVVDFVHFHIGEFSWYVFNLADVWIVAGAIGLLYDSFTSGPNSAAK